jgi:methylglutamate dehydrogenase subunit C
MTAFRKGDGTRIDRSRSIGFTFDGRPMQAHPGDTAASALLANGALLLGRSFKLHRPRGVFSTGPEEPNALLTVGEGARAAPNLPATLVEIEQGMRIESQNRWPSLKTDLLSINDRLSRFLSAGFYYKTFMAPGRFWERLYEPLIRRAAGLGKASGLPDPDAYETVHHHCEHLVIGGGEAGRAAALAAGSDVILCDERPPLSRQSEHRALALSRTTVIGAYDHGCFAAIERVLGEEQSRTGIRERLHIIRARGITLATGAQERLIAFDGNDRPGVMLAGAALRFGQEFGVAAGRRIVLFANNDRAYEAAFAMPDEIAAIVDSRETSAAMEQAAAFGFALHRRAAIEGTAGRLGLSSCIIRMGEDAKGIIQPCDALLISGGFNPNLQLLSQAGGTTRYDARIVAFVPDRIPSGWSITGDASGESLPGLQPLFEIRSKKRGSKAFVDLQNDVTADDIRLAAQEGYSHIEHAKRYTTHGMGTDQGKTGGLVGAAVLAQARGATLAETGLSKPRPFVTPASWGALAGPETGLHFKPERRLPLHSWHEVQGAAFLKAGSWLRPLYYRKSGETGWDPVLREARAVRESVGFTDVSSLGKIDVQGPDAATFLDRIYANTISTLKPGMTRYGLMLREDGMVFDDGTVARLSHEHFVLSSTTANAAAVLEHMEFHASAVWPELDLRLTNITDHWAVIAVAGPNARKLVEKLVPIDLANAAFPFMAFAETLIAGIPGRLFRISFSGELAYELAIPSGHARVLAEAILAAGEEFGVIPYGLEALSVMRIEKGHVTGTEITGRSTAADLGFGKLCKKSGDFVGAALAQRPALLAPDRQVLVGIRLETGTRLRAGALLLNHPQDRASLGFITAATLSVEFHGWIGLALLENGRERMGEVLTAASPVFGESARVRIVSPHHLDPENSRVRA